MNYFNYFTEIEDAFVRRRGKNLLLSPLDWALIDAWRERDIPLHIVLRAIEAVFDIFDQNPRPRSIKSLMFCREEVEAQFAEWQASRTGAASDTQTEAAAGIPVDDIRAHITDTLTQLRAVSREELEEDLLRACSRLEQLAEELSDDPETADKSLNDIEKFLEEAMLERLDKQFLKSFEKETAKQLREYKSGMEKDAYEQTFRLLLLKRLREELGIPRLGLFYL